jgi:hypothetical protein
MAQVYPEDRGTNYAIREGRRVAGAIAHALTTSRRAVSSGASSEVDVAR